MQEPMPSQPPEEPPASHRLGEVEGALFQLTAPDALPRPLCVELDGTLISSPTSWESAFKLLRRKPWLVLLLPFWLMGGSQRLARELERHAPLDPAVLPYRPDLLLAIRQAAAEGRRIVLLGGPSTAVARAVASHLSVFDRVLDDEPHEPDLRTRLDAAFAPGGFDFVGHDTRALALDGLAERVLLVGAAPAVVRAAAGRAAVRVLSERPSALRAAVRVLRPHQWAKNALVFLPLLLSPAMPTPGIVLRAALATAMFSLVASSGYVLNDLLDLDADRAHATKRNRPFASGALPIAFGPPLFFGLIGVAFTLSALALPPLFVAMLGLYFVATVSYSMWLKQRLLLDVLLLAGLYTHRIFSGGAATGIPISSWLLAFSMFFFLSLAFMKRYIELRATKGSAKLKSRGYGREDLEIVGPSGTATGYMAVLVFALYVEGPDVSASYRAPGILWAACPVLIYWLGSMWFLAHRGLVEDDPVKYALKDPRSWLCALIIAVIAALARFGPVLVG